MQRTRRADFSPIKPILESVLRKIDLVGKREEGRICELWEESVGEKIAKHTHPHSLTSRGRLLVNVDSSPWVDELTRYHKENIKRTINKILGQEIVKDIFFRVGKIG